MYKKNLFSNSPKLGFSISALPKIWPSITNSKSLTTSIKGPDWRRKNPNVFHQLQEQKHPRIPLSPLSLSLRQEIPSLLFIIIIIIWILEFLFSLLQKRELCLSERSQMPATAHSTAISDSVSEFGYFHWFCALSREEILQLQCRQCLDDARGGIPWQIKTHLQVRGF